MADESRGTDAGVSLTPIYTDDKGRRRRGDVEKQDVNDLDQSSQIKVLSDRVLKMEQEMKLMSSELQQVRADYDSDTITGPGHSGNGKGKSFNPSMTVQAQCDPDNPGVITGTVTLS